MKLIIQNNRIAATATDDYQPHGGEQAVHDAPAGFDTDTLDECRYEAGALIVPDPQTRLIAALSAAVQAHLDDWAKTRGYDGILSACSYATSTSPRFGPEGIAALAARDAAWAACYTIMSGVQAGTHVMPTAASLIAELPVMAWPA